MDDFFRKMLKEREQDKLDDAAPVSELIQGIFDWNPPEMKLAAPEEVRNWVLQKAVETKTTTTKPSANSGGSKTTRAAGPYDLHLAPHLRLKRVRHVHNLHTVFAALAKEKLEERLRNGELAHPAPDTLFKLPSRRRSLVTEYPPHMKTELSIQTFFTSVISKIIVVVASALLFHPSNWMDQVLVYNNVPNERKDAVTDGVLEINKFSLRVIALSESAESDKSQSQSPDVSQAGSPTSPQSQEIEMSYEAELSSQGNDHAEGVSREVEPRTIIEPDGSKTTADVGEEFPTEDASQDHLDHLDPATIQELLSNWMDTSQTSNVLDLMEHFSNIGVWEMKSLSVGDHHVMFGIQLLAARSPKVPPFQWKACKNRKCIGTSGHLPRTQTTDLDDPSLKEHLIDPLLKRQGHVEEETPYDNPHTFTRQTRKAVDHNQGVIMATAGASTQSEARWDIGSVAVDVNAVLQDKLAQETPFRDGIYCHSDEDSDQEDDKKEESEEEVDAKGKKKKKKKPLKLRTLLDKAKHPADTIIDESLRRGGCSIKKVRKMERRLRKEFGLHYNKASLADGWMFYKGAQNTAESLLQQAWAQGVKTRQTVIVLHSGNYEFVAIRHRASQTLFISDLLHPQDMKNPGYGQYMVGLCIFAVEDALRRIKMNREFDEEARQIVDSSPGPAEDGPPPGGDDGGFDDSGDDEDWAEPAPKKAKRDSSGASSISTSKSRGGGNGGAQPSEPKRKGKGRQTTAYPAGSLEALAVVQLASSRPVALMRLAYSVYESPHPIIFARGRYRSEGSISFASIADSDGSSLEDSITLTITSAIRTGETRMVHGGIVSVQCNGSVSEMDIVAKMAFDDQDREALRREYSAYQTLAAHRVTGVPDCLGIYSDVNEEFGGAVCLLLSAVRHNMKKSPSHPDILRVLDSIHSAGILHGNISPGHVLAEDSGKHYMIDFASATFNAPRSLILEERRRLTEMLQGVKL